MCDTSLRPLSSDFESSGTLSALLRTCKAISKDFFVPELPRWLFESRLADVVGSEVEVGVESSDILQKEALAVIEPLSKLETVMLERMRALRGTNCPKSDEECLSPDAARGGKLPVVCLARLLLGSCCEAYISLKCYSLVRPGDRVKVERDVEKVARLYKDALLVATWTSAHALYLHTLMCHKISPCSPSIHSVPNESSELDLSDLYARRTSPKILSNFKDSTHMLSLMTRCTNPGSRGWNSILKQALEKSEGTRRVCWLACTVSITGMTSRIHPANRLHWKDRLVLGNSLANMPCTMATTLSQGCPVEMKEVIRRMLSNCTSSTYATNAALLRIEHPVALLGPCPLKLTVAGLESSATAFARAGKALVASGCSQDLVKCVSDAFYDQSQPDSTGECCELVWNSSYLGNCGSSIGKIDRED